MGSLQPPELTRKTPQRNWERQDGSFNFHPNFPHLQISRMPKALPPVHLSPGIESKHIPVRDLNLHYLSSGDPASPLLILLHGFPELCYSWRRVIEPLARLGYFVVAPDSRGYGRTTSLDSPEKVVHYDDDIAPYSMLNLAHDVVALVYALGYRTCSAVIGHDFGSPVAAHVALIRPDIFKSVVMMSAPFTGPASLPFNVIDNPPTPESETPFWVLADRYLAQLDPPRKHYTAYFTTPEANTDMWNAPRGLHTFLRGYFYMKSADWSQNDPHPISIAEAGSMPHYYIMPADLTMPQVVEHDVPSPDEVAQNTWLSDAELAVFTAEYARTGFQGGLNRYRCMRDTRWVNEVAIFADRKIEVPAMFLSGKKDWGVYQYPGAVTKMKDEVCANMADGDFVLVDGAGHWVQQEQPDEVVKHIARFLKKSPTGADATYKDTGDMKQ
ncbi:alpha/beta-hydrolase [Cristinia sonorae]|uniref:Alpha/beta-hydrolase n=1 Tax=Cristinia sonorae TaxID=1940300 RepID=A0A8K0UHK0_9AGAR|nr:alpha/beta-hydrolase [Cristinia sonorae]